MEDETRHGNDHEQVLPARRCSEDNKDKQDRFLPVANVGRIMKKVVPGNGKISKDAKDTIKECVSEFISFVTVEASDKCRREKRKTINGDDIIWAITTLGFEDYVVPLKLYLNRYRENEGKKLDDLQEQQQLISTELPQPNTLAHFQANHLYSSSTPLLSHHQKSFQLNRQNISSPTSFHTQFQQDQMDSTEHW